MTVVREEVPGDAEGIRRVTVAAFAAGDHGHHGEADLIDRLRESGGDSLSLVATLSRAGAADAEIVGHILFTPVSIRNRERETAGMGLAPMAVAPHVQRVGVGSRLIESGLERLFGQGCLLVVVLGHPDYYPRFGFRPAAGYGVEHGFAGIPQDVFFVNASPACPVAALRGGKAFYREEFGPQHAT